jgi:hypothetical protein
VTFTAGSFSPSVSTVAAIPATVVANGVDTTVVTVTVKDAQGNPISGAGVTLEVSGTSNTIRQPAGVTGLDGVAVGSVKSTKAEGKDITAKVGGVEVSTKPHVTFAPGLFSPGGSDVQVDKTSATADGVDPITVTVYVRDAYGNGISGRTVSIAATGSGNIFVQPAGTTDQNGMAVATLRSTVAEPKTISATANGSPITKMAQVAFGSGTLHHFVVTHAGTATAGQASYVTIDARDAQSNKITNFAGIAKVYTSSVVPGDYISWGLGSAAGSIISEVGDTVRYQFAPADSGDAELAITDTKVESITIYAASGAVTSSSATQLVVGHAAADRILIVSGNNQRAVVNQEVSSSLVTRVEDAYGNPAPGVTMTWAVTKGSGYVDASRTIPGQQTTSTTAADGTASCELWRLGTVSGLNSDAVTASMPTGTTRSVIFDATTDHGPIASIVLTPASKSVTVGTPTIVTATMHDAFGNNIPDEYVTIFVKDTPDGTLSAAAGSPTDPLGSYARRGMSDSTGTVSVTYNAPAGAGLMDVIDANSNTIPAGSVADVTYTTVASGATDLRSTVLSGATSQAGVTFSFRVEAVDGNGNRDLTSTNRVAIDPPVGGGFTYSLTDFGAPVTEADLVAGAVTLYGRGSSVGVWQTQVRDETGPLSPDQFAITIVPNDTVSSYVVTEPPTATAGIDFTVTAEAKDRFGNRVTSAGYTLSFRAVRGADSTAAASGSLSVTSGSLVNGFFSGSAFHYTVAEAIRVELSSAANPVKGYGGVTAVGPASAYQLAKIGGDSSGVAVGDSVLLRARVADRYGNAMSGQTVFFSVQQGGGHLASPQAVTDGAGRVALWFRTSTVKGTNVVRALILDGDPEGLETQSFTVTTVPRTTIARVTLSLPGSTFLAGESFRGDVAAYDGYDNLIDTDSSTELRCVASHATMGFVPATMTLDHGTSFFTASDTTVGVNRIRVLSLAGDSLSDWSGPLTIGPAGAYRIAEVHGDTAGVRAGAKVGIEARVRDRYGNAVPAEIVRFVITSNLGGSPSLWDATDAPNDGLVRADAAGAAVCSLTTDSHAGTNTVSASILDANPPSLERVIFTVGTAAGTITRFDVTPDGFAKKAGQLFQLQLVAYDLNGNEATSDDTSRVALGSNGSAAFSVNPATLFHGRATVTVHDNKAEKLVLRAQTLAGGATSYSDTIIVSPEAPAGAIAFASIVPDTITANGTSTTAITTQPVHDPYGNVVPPGTLVRVTPSLGTVASDDQDPTTPATFERQTGASGAVSVFVRSAASPGTSTIAFTSITGSASGTAIVPFTAAPFCVYAGYLTPRYLVPTHAAAFRCSTANTSATGLYLNTQSKISFADSLSHTFEAHLAAPAFVRGASADTLDFESVVVPSGMLGGAYTPRVRLVGTDIHGSPYQVEFDAGSNSVSVSSIEILRVTTPSIVSRGDTFDVVVRIRNNGGSTLSVSDIVPSYRHGSFGLTGPWSPPLPNNLTAGTDRDYTRSMYVLGSSALGPDTIDASVTATANGSQVQDASASPNTSPILVQSAASIAYVPATLSPGVVSRGQTHGFSVVLRNDGQAAVILSGSATRLSFTDGVDTVQVTLGVDGALPGGRTTTLTFPAVLVPLAMDAGSWPVSLRLRGTENGGSFSQTIVPGDRVTVVDPAQLAYHAGSIAPASVSKRSSAAFEVGIDNAGGATVVCTPDSTWITFASGPVVYRARLDGSRGTAIPPGMKTLYFTSVTVPDAMPTGSYAPTVRVKGTENGNIFTALLSPSDHISVENPPQLAISSTGVGPRDSVTADQGNAWFATIHVDNNGGASVRLDSLAVRLYAGPTEVTSECLLTPLNFNPHVDVIAGGAGADILVRLADNPVGPMTIGTTVIESAIWGRDMNSGAVLLATTELGGKGSYLVQTPATVTVVAVETSADTVTASQSRDWTVDAVLANTGQSSVTLNLNESNTYLTFSTSGDFLVESPSSLVGGGLVLGGGATDTLRYRIDRTGSAAGLCRIESTVRGTEINSGRAIAVSSGASSVYGAVVVETPADLHITHLTAMQDPVTIGQLREWTIEMEVTNAGGSDATLLLDRTDSTWVSVDGGSGFSIENPVEAVGGGRTLRGGGSLRLPFVVRATGSIPPGRRSLTGGILAVENNSGRAVHAELFASSSTDSVTFQRSPDPGYLAGSLAPTRVSSGASVSFQTTVMSDDASRSTLVLDPERVALAFGDADGDTFRTTLSPVSELVLPGDGSIDLLFRNAMVDTAIAHTAHPVSLHLAGTENGNPFAADIAPLDDSVSVERAPQLAITRIVAPPSVTRSQTAAWPVYMVLKNNGEASVVVDLAAAKTFLTFNIVGLGDRTFEYTIAPPAGFEGSGSDTLAGGVADSLRFVVTTTGSTSGLALVNGKVTAVDVNSALTIVDDTFDGGFSYVAIQAPGAPVIAGCVPSRGTVTSGQSAPWRVTVEVCNEGEAALTLVPDSLSIFYDARTPLPHGAPAAFVEGGTLLGGGTCRHLLFEISPTPAIPAGADIAIHAHAGFVEGNSAEYRFFDTRAAGSGSGTIRVQAPARLAVALTTNDGPRAPYVNAGQQFPVSVEVRNEGEAIADSVRVALEHSGASLVADTVLVLRNLGGGLSAADTFSVAAAPSAGVETFRARLRGALDANSREGGLVALLPAVDDTATAVIQTPASLAVSSVTPSQASVNAKQAVDWTVRVSLTNGGQAPLTLSPPTAGNLAFSRGGPALTDYLVIPPDTLASGSSQLVLPGGASDALVYRIASTGRDTGNVTISVSIPWADLNDPPRPTVAAAGAGSVQVRPPSGLRIVEVTSDAPNSAALANTSVVDTGQRFDIVVRTENTGGDDLDSVTVRLVSNGPSRTTIVGDSLGYLAAHSTRDFMFSVEAAATSGTEILSASITHAVSVNTGERVIPAEAVESVENLRVELPAILACSASITGPPGALDDTLSTEQSFIVSAVVANEGQALIDTTGEISLVLPPAVHRASPAEPLVKRFAAGESVSWTLVTPTASSRDTLRALISFAPNDLNIASPAAVRVPDASIIVTTEPSARVTACAISISSPLGAVDGTISTDQDFIARSVFTPSASADLVSVELTVPPGFTVSGDRVKVIGRGDGSQKIVTWAVQAPSAGVSVDTLAATVGGKDVNSGSAMPGCHVSFPVHVQQKPVLDLSAEISGPSEALDGVVSTDLSFTVSATVSRSGEADIDTSGARVEIVLPAGQGYALDGAGEQFRKPFVPGQAVVWTVRAPSAPTPPSNIETRLGPYPKDVNTGASCDVETASIFIPVQTEEGAVLMSNISREDTIPPYVVPQGAEGVPLMRATFRNNSGYTIGLDTVYVAVKDGRGGLLGDAERSVASIACITGSGAFRASVTGTNPVPVVVGHGFEISPSAVDTVLFAADIAPGAKPGEIRFEIGRSRDVVMSISLPGGGAGPRIGVALELNGADIAGQFLSGPLSVMSGRFDEYVHNYPNPFRAGSQATRICYFLKQNAAVAISIYDLDGRLVWTRRIGAGEPGGTGTSEGTWHEIPWDGRNDRGDVVRNGVYVCKVEAGPQSALIKIAVAK